MCLENKVRGNNPKAKFRGALTLTPIHTGFCMRCSIREEVEQEGWRGEGNWGLTFSGTDLCLLRYLSGKLVRISDLRHGQGVDELAAQVVDGSSDPYAAAATTGRTKVPRLLRM